MDKKGQSDGTIAGVVVFLLILVIGTIVAVAGFDKVDASHQGVMVRFGEIKGTMDPGLKWTGVFTHVYQYDLRVRSATVKMLADGSATDKDGQAVYGEVNVNYRLKHNIVEQLYADIGKDDVVEERLLIEPIIREGFKQATVQYEAIEILENRQEVKELAKSNIASNFPSEYFEIDDIVVANIDFSDQFKQAIEDKKTATQERLKEAELVEVVRLQQEQEIIRYEAEAKKLELQKKQITDQLNTQAMISKWNGAFPQTLIITNDASGANLFLQMATGGTEGLDTNDKVDILDANGNKVN